MDFLTLCVLNPLLLQDFLGFLKGFFKDMARRNQLMELFFHSEGSWWQVRGAVLESYQSPSKTLLPGQCEL